MTNPLKAEQLEILQTIAAADAGVGADAVDSRQTKGLLKRGYVMSLPRADEPSLLMITQAGREAAGILNDAPAFEATDDEADLQPSVDAPPADVAPAKATKKATVRAMLERPEGASIKQLCDSTGWLPHSVRGMIAGALKKDGMAISSAKVEGVRIYRAEAPAA